MEYLDSVRTGEQLRAWIVTKGLTEQRLAELVSTREGVPVSQSWISRICTGDFRRTSGKVGAVLRYAGIEPRIPVGADRRGKKILANALGEVWDGTLPSAEAIAAVIRSVGRVARMPSHQRPAPGRGRLWE